MQVVRFKDMPIEGVNIPKEDENKVMHVGLPIGKDQILMGTDVLESLGQKLVVGNNTYISIHPDSKEEADRIFIETDFSNTQKELNKRASAKFQPLAENLEKCVRSGSKSVF